MKTGLTKKQKRTSIYFTEADDFVEICTYNTDFKKRLSEFAVKYPAECRQLDDDGNGCKTFAVKKGRFGIRLTAPYSEKRRQAASELAKKNTQNLRRYIQRIPKSFVAKYKIHICIFYAVVDIFMLRTCVKRNGSPSF